MRRHGGTSCCLWKLTLGSLGLAAAFRAQQGGGTSSVLVRERAKRAEQQIAASDEHMKLRLNGTANFFDVGAHTALEEAQGEEDDRALVKFEGCFKKLRENNLTLEDFHLERSLVEELFEPFDEDCVANWWSNDHCRSEWARKIAVEYFLRGALVGEVDDGEPTLYTPIAQEVAVRTMWKLFPLLRSMGPPAKPTREFMEKLFIGINVADGGSWNAMFGNLVAYFVNRGRDEELYRSKTVVTRLYPNVDEPAIRKYNTMTYPDMNGSTIPALDIASVPFSDLKSFVYKFPPGPGHIVTELERVLQEFDVSDSMIDNLATAERWIRELVVLHPFTDSNGRTARLALNLLLMANGMPTTIMKKQDEDMTTSPAELQNKICEGMVYATKMT